MSEGHQFGNPSSWGEKRSPAMRRTSPMTSKVGAGRRGASSRFLTLVKKTCPRTLWLAK